MEQGCAPVWPSVLPLMSPGKLEGIPQIHTIRTEAIALFHDFQATKPNLVLIKKINKNKPGLKDNK